MYVCVIVAGRSGFFGNFLHNIRNDRNIDNNDTRIAVIMSEHAHVQYVRSMLYIILMWSDCSWFQLANQGVVL